MCLETIARRPQVLPFVFTLFFFILFALLGVSRTSLPSPATSGDTGDRVSS